ncbi:diguanylate cyclase/phosphodiesterase (GGDEF & EAL domains) with PAS/PAC sensor(s) [hydrothermal vent metagenome]|uniref:Diguanylate cyclase/phosphodiesterase (GGDEF & EAL domains) with PAS/PAC sensor(S) n=1 Tax=hydrothermal vent metagenome TaxID=652676 RepID=A0A3B0YAZ8_9ZZZZ
MSLILSVSVFIRLIAMIWALHLWYRVRDWRIGFLGAMVALMALRQSLTLSKKGLGWPPQLSSGMDEIPGLAVSVLALLSIIFLGRMISDERRRSSELIAANQELENQIVRRHKAEDKLLTLSQAIEQSPESIFITNAEAEIEYVNAAFIRNTGYSMEEALGENPRILKSGKTSAETYTHLWDNLSQGKPWQGELYNRRKDNSECIEWSIISPVRESSGKISHYVAINQDITEKKQTEAKINHLAYYNSLTDLPNRTLLMERLNRTLGLLERDENKGALFLVNIDRFKNINDARGHTLGDALLKMLGKRLSELLYDSGTVAHLASDEFAILVPELGLQLEQARHRALIISGKILDAIRQPITIDNEEIHVTASLGITIFPEPYDDEGTILRRADTALHRAKESGRNQSAFFETDMSESAEQRYLIERELRHAVANGELRLFIQPQVDKYGKLVGAEALVRWQHPERGLVPPGVFIPVAEESDLILDVGDWVLSEALQLMAKGDMAGHPFHLAVNLSPRQFRQTNFIPWLKDLLNLTGADPNHLTLEVTEGLVIENINEVIARMSEIAALGVHFSIDDFGTGYSSLSYLKRLPVHELKIDRSFIQDAPVNESDAALVETILAVAEHMHLKVVAEGVETEEQAAFLNARADVIHQGYLYGKPEPMDIWFERWFGEPLA